VLISRRNAREGSHQPVNGKPFHAILKHFATIELESDRLIAFEKQARVVKNKKINKNRHISVKTSPFVGMYLPVVSAI
jgi:hypothetical protein